jgi:hypothetical protein
VLEQKKELEKVTTEIKKMNSELEQKVKTAQKCCARHLLNWKNQKQN